MAVILEARVWTKTDTYEGWMANPLLLGEGEMALVVGATGTPLNMRWGQKTPKRFSELPNAISYDQGAFISVNSLILPTPSVSVGYSIVGGGVYKYENQSDVVVANGNLGILYWDGAQWSLDSSLPIPTNIADGKVEQGDVKSVSGDAVYKAIEPIEDVLFDTIDAESPNLYNPEYTYFNKLVSNGVNAGIMTSNGWNTLAVNGLKPLTYYTISNWNSTRNEVAIYASEIPLELPATAYVKDLIASGASNQVIGGTKSGGKLTFQTPSNIYAIALTVKSNTEQSSVFETFQIEEGTVATPYKPYAPGGVQKVLKPQFLPQGKIKEISLSSNIVYIRTKHNLDKDLVRSIGLYSSANGSTNLLSSKLIGSDEPITVAGELIHNQNDSVPPPFQVQARKESNTAYFNVSGNHGLPTVSDITVTGHNKTNSDLGSIWSDSAGDQYYLVAILSANSLRIVPKPVNVGGFERVKNTAVSPLTHVSGGINTSSFTFTGSAYEYKPSINNLTVKLYIDDKEVSTEGSYIGDVVKIIDTHNVVDPTKPNLIAPYLPQNGGTMVKNTLIHTFYHNGSYSAEQIADWQSNHNIANQGIVQPQVLTQGSYSGIKAFSANIGVVGSIDFMNGVDLSSGATIPTVTVNNNHKIDSTKSIQLISEILYSSNGPKLGFGCAYNPLIGLGKQSELALNTSIFELRNTRKFYPVGFNRVSDNKILRGNGIYAYWDASVNPKLSADFYIPVGLSCLYFLNISSAMFRDKVYLDEELQLREFKIINSSSNIIINTPDYSTSEGLIITGSVGDWCILQFI